MRKALWGVAVAASALVVIASASADGRGVFKTSQPAMLTSDVPNSRVTPIITVGDTLASGYRFESIPDGIAFRSAGFFPTTVDVYVNHETSTVPFPYNPSAPTEANSQNDFDNSQLSHLVLSRNSSPGVISGEYAISSSENYQRFCSNFLATAAQGFDRPLLLHERGGDRLGQAHGQGVPGDDRRCRCEADRPRRRPRSAGRRDQADLGDGAPQPREQRRDPGLRPSGRALG